MAKPVIASDIVMTPVVVHYDTEAFDVNARSNGVVMEHWRAIRCPLGIGDRFDIRSHGDHSNCSNGFLYRYAGDITVFFSGNSSSIRLEDVGLVDGSTTQITLPHTYDNSEEEVAVQHYDRFFLKEMVATSVNTQLVEAHITGYDRLQYQATKVEHIIDANGIEYGVADISIENGQVHWLNAARRPQYDAKNNRGTVYAIRYRYQPFWYVKNIVHEVRISRAYDHALQQEVVKRLPYAVMLQREYAFENEERSLREKADMRDVKSPRNGSFGPR
jgi:hypothetical protein